MIDVNDLHKSYGSVRALDGVTFSVPQGQVVGLLGPNGAGKTTAMRILTGYVAPTSGTATIDGIDVCDEPLACQRRIGYLPEGNPLYTDLRVTEALRFVAELQGLKGEPRTRAIADAIEAVGLGEVRRRTIGTLSKGYKQRVGLAQALLHRPPVLILDEPTTGLDPNQQQDMRELIKELGKEHTVILSTHVLPEVEAVCQRALIISQGRLAADGTIDAIRTQAARGRTGGGAALVAVRAEAPAAQEAFRGLPFVLGVDLVDRQVEGPVTLRLRFDAPADPARMERVAALCFERRLALSRLEPVVVELEEIFAVLTGGSVAPGGDAAQPAAPQP